MARLKWTTTTVSLLAEMSHILCCGLPIFVAVMSAGGQIGFGGAFLVFHSWMHAYELQILIGSGIILAFGFGLHVLSFWFDSHATSCEHDNREPKKFRAGWIFTIALLLYAANLTFYFVSGHGSEPPRFN
ncbi:MAG: hypothetical protein ACR2PG_17060 [Hyphomicrobiaceae bacterium]